jgi:hypothetical protein
MKKILFTLLICMSIFAKPSFAGTCNGGEEFKGVVNGHTYCRSQAQMTWWAAIAWCKKQGRELASMDQLCDWKNVAGDTSCPNMKVSGVEHWGYSSSPSGAEAAFFVNMLHGNYSIVNRSGRYNAVCY